MREDEGRDGRKQFIKTLKALDSLPGSEKFMGPVHDVIAMLEGTKAPTDAPGPASAPETSASGVEVTGFTHLRAATAVVIGNPLTKSCANLAYPGAPSSSASSSCLRVTIGPMIVTDVVWSEGCPAETFAFAGDPDQPAWFLRADEGRGFAIHGAAFIIPEFTPLFVGHRSTTPLQASTACTITWAGRRP